MVDKRIADYLRNGLNKGYPIGSLRTALINQKQNPAKVDEAIRYVRGRGNGPKEVSKKPAMLAAIIISIIIIVALSYFIISKINLKKELDLTKKDEILRCNALVNNNDEICESISKEYLKESCFKMLYMKRAIDTSNTAICEEIKRYASNEEVEGDTYYTCLLLAAKDKSICDMPFFSADKGECEIFVEFINDSSVEMTEEFQALSIDWKDEFYKFKAAISKDSSFCSLIQDEILKSQWDCLVLSEDNAIREEGFCSENVKLINK